MGRRAPGPRGGRVPLAPLALAAAVAAWGCARPSSPPGAPEESRPPAVRSLTPAMDTVLSDLSGAATIRFDEPIRTRSDLGRRMVASPAYEYSVSVGHSEVSVRPEGGWRPGVVYVLEFPPGVTDLLDNSRTEPVRLVFSTGPPIRPTRVRLRLFDRVTGQEQARGRVLFLPAGREAARESARAESDTAGVPADTVAPVPYTAVADSADRYVLRHLPPGSYWAFGFVDRNRNLRLDRRLEPYDSTRVDLASDTARASAALFLLEPDSTPPRLATIEARDSVTVRLTFDDYLRPGHRPREPLVQPVGGTNDLSVREVRVPAAADTAGQGAPPADSAGPASGDSLTADSAAAEAPSEEGAATPDSSVGPDTLSPDSAADDSAASDTAGVQKPPRPTRIVEIRLARPPSPDTFRVRLRGVRNMRGLEADVDTTFGYVPPPDTAAADTAGAPHADSTAHDSTSRADSTVTDTAISPPDPLLPDSAAPDTAARRT